MLQTTWIIDEPLLHAGIPLIGEPLPLGFHLRLPVDAALMPGKAITLQLQSPLPATARRLCHKAAPIKLREPLLSWIPCLPDTGLPFNRLKGMTPRLIRRTDAGPVRLRQTLRHLIG